MNFKPDEIYQVASTIWEATLGLPIEPAEPARPPSRMTVSAVQISGAWSGSIVLECPQDVARLAASSMFGTDLASLTEEDLQDAVAELVNMIGGNLKGLLPETCHLSLPMTITETQCASGKPESRELGRVGFACQGQTVSILVVERCQGKCAAA